MAAGRYKRPESVLVVVHTPRTVLLLRRADDPSFWQSVTGSLEWDETDLAAVAARELYEETGIPAGAGILRDLQMVHRFPLLPAWRLRYAPDVDSNTEHAFDLALTNEHPVRLSSEHVEFAWLPFHQARERATSWTDRAVIAAFAAHSGAR